MAPTSLTVPDVPCLLQFLPAGNAYQDNNDVILVSLSRLIDDQPPRLRFFVNHDAAGNPVQPIRFPGAAFARQFVQSGAKAVVAIPIPHGGDFGEVLNRGSQSDGLVAPRAMGRRSHRQHQSNRGSLEGARDLWLQLRRRQSHRSLQSHLRTSPRVVPLRSRPRRCAAPDGVFEVVRREFTAQIAAGGRRFPDPVDGPRERPAKGAGGRHAPSSSDPKSWEVPVSFTSATPGLFAQAASPIEKGATPGRAARVVEHFRRSAIPIPTRSPAPAASASRARLCREARSTPCCSATRPRAKGRPGDSSMSLMSRRHGSSVGDFKFEIPSLPPSSCP